MQENYEIVNRSFRILLKALLPYVIQELKNEYDSDWWQLGVLEGLYDDQKRNLPTSGSEDTLQNSIDIQICLILFADVHWQTIFRKKLSVDHRTWANELKTTRNDLAHIGKKDFSDDDTWRALDTMARLITQIDAEKTEEIRKTLRQVRYGSELGSTAVKQQNGSPANAVQASKILGILTNSPANLPSWREVMEPHQDVSQGNYKKAEFAADLAQVARGEAALEYQDPVEFFARTYVTEGISSLLEQSLRRLCDKGGEPVIQLKTAFGGGKTHSMLALFHAIKGAAALKDNDNLKEILENIGMEALPKANLAVLVGTSLDTTKAKRPPYMPGITINTFWGEITAQLAHSTGKPELYEMIKEADRKGVSPGSETLKNIFDAAGPSLILIDEMVSYARKLYGASNLPAGSFENFITFIQELTEAARASKNSLVVASIPESEYEIGGEAGEKAHRFIEHTFGRMEAIWKPVTAMEGFEVVRRRLFLDCQNPVAREKVCAAFSKMYLANSGDFPSETRELEYKQRMIDCYPIHPEVFDRLYEDWATLDNFQRTRGVLRLMAAVIHELWMGNDAGLLIMPGSIPLNIPNVRDELTRYLPEGWNAVLDKEVDGKQSAPFKTDEETARFGKILAARRVARTILLGSAPSSRKQTVRGLASSQIRLGAAQPGDNIAIFNDALSNLKNNLSYLYSDNSANRFWYDTRPTLLKTAEDRSKQFEEADLEYEITKRLRKIRNEAPFAGVHICPASSLDIPDDQSARLVILRPDDTYRNNNSLCSALTAVNDLLDNRGTSPRSFRNMLSFVAADQGNINALKEAVRMYLAWYSIDDERESLNLDAEQNRQSKNNLNTWDATVEARLKETYCWLLVPVIDRNVDIRKIYFDAMKISGGDDPIVRKAGRKLLSSEYIIQRWAANLLNMLLNDLFLRNEAHISYKQVWESLCTYCYMPKLAKENVFMEAVIQAIANSDEYFAFAAGFDGKRYIDIKYNQQLFNIEKSGLLVKNSIAKQQLIAEEEQRRKEEQDRQQDGEKPEQGSFVFPPTTDSPGHRVTNGKTGTDDGKTADDTITEQAPKKRFYMSAELDVTRVIRDAQKYVEEVITHLISADASSVKINLEIEANKQNGFDQKTIRTISENCQTLKTKDFGFEEE